MNLAHFVKHHIQKVINLFWHAFWFTYFVWRNVFTLEAFFTLRYLLIPYIPPLAIIAAIFGFISWKITFFFIFASFAALSWQYVIRMLYGENGKKLEEGADDFHEGIESWSQGAQEGFLYKPPTHAEEYYIHHKKVLWFVTLPLTLISFVLGLTAFLN